MFYNNNYTIKLRRYGRSTNNTKLLAAVYSVEKVGERLKVLLFAEVLRNRARHWSATRTLPFHTRFDEETFIILL